MALFPASAVAAEVGEAGWIITGDRDAFCRHFSTVNALTFQTPRSVDEPRPTYGGSADPPSTRLAPETRRRRAAASKAAKAAARASRGPWKPRSCPECPPTATEMYETIWALSKHVTGPFTRGAMDTPALPAARVWQPDAVQDGRSHAATFPQAALGSRPCRAHNVLAQHLFQAQAGQGGGPDPRPTGVQAPAVLPSGVPNSPTVLLRRPLPRARRPRARRRL